MCTIKKAGELLVRLVGAVLKDTSETCTHILHATALFPVLTGVCMCQVCNCVFFKTAFSILFGVDSSPEQPKLLDVPVSDLRPLLTKLMRS